MSVLGADQSSEILSFMESQKTEMIDFLEKLVKAESPSTDPLQHVKSQALITNKLESLGFRVFKIDGIDTGGHIFARPILRQRGFANQLLLGHSDTVWPLDTLKKMDFKVNSSRIHGPGVYDMKCGITQIMFAIQCIRDLKLKTSIKPLIFINSDEEIGSKESSKYIRWLSRISERVFVLEPPLGLEGKLKTGRKGIGRFTLEVFGKAAHAGLDPEGGASAILELSRLIQQLFEMNDHENGVSVNVGMIEGGARVNVIAPSSKAIIDVRVPTLEDVKILTRKILSLKPSSNEFELKIEGEFGRLPMERTKANQKLWHLALREGRKMGLELEQGFAGGGSDGNITSLYTATLDGLGTTGDGAHAPHEFAFVNSLVERSALLTLLIIANSIT